MNILDEWGKVSRWLMREHNLTHVGTHFDGCDPLVWGLRYPDCRLLILSADMTEAVTIDRANWEKITDRLAPWPWSEDGKTMVIDESKSCHQTNR